MRLLHTSRLELSEFFCNNIPPYAILSHRWEDEEVAFRDLETGKGKSMRGWTKITSCCAQAAREKLEWAWVDTCCIDKSSSAELSEAINSMFQWYKNAEICYGYLSDVDIRGADESQVESRFKNSKWFKRGWTLQELLAPRKMMFYDKSWVEIASRLSLLDSIAAITGIELPRTLSMRYHYAAEEIICSKINDESSAAQKLSWISRRTTTREEDMSYCMLGLLGVNMPLLYGEGGRRAFHRLQIDFIARSTDESIYAWQREAGAPPSGMLADAPSAFSSAQSVKSFQFFQRPACFMRNTGLHIDLPLMLSRKLTFEVSRKLTFREDVAKVTASILAVPLNAVSSRSTDSRPLIIYIAQLEKAKGYALPLSMKSWKRIGPCEDCEEGYFGKVWRFGPPSRRAGARMSIDVSNEAWEIDSHPVRNLPLPNEHQLREMFRKPGLWDRLTHSLGRTDLR